MPFNLAPRPVVIAKPRVMDPAAKWGEDSHEEAHAKRDEVNQHKAPNLWGFVPLCGH
ncbi:hypothetical protein PDESU_05465 [Pontiella desulfatans]|uniref:Uncharacterized protein n=1 Tax=Pontiella desulfatans TaxID=2750659 RepID=A0A6C2UAJ1_PONDE|nr:hypothetical protein PDESU_05465 [Pontiella desulfatans]